MIQVLSNQNSIFNQFITEIRDSRIQEDRLRFRKNIERLGEIMAYEISKTLSYKSTITTTPLGEATTRELEQQPVIASILRAGLPLHNGILHLFDKAQNAFVSAYRKHEKGNSFEVQIEYLSCPDLTDKVLLLSDVMVATGSSMLLAYKALLNKGQPLHTHIVSVISSKDGLKYLNKHLPPGKFTIWTGAVDEELTAQAYIVPGLGDAGDLAYGEKV